MDYPCAFGTDKIMYINVAQTGHTNFKHEGLWLNR
jgi:hypothetical protein